MLCAIAVVVLVLHGLALSALGPGRFDAEAPATDAAQRWVRSVFLLAPGALPPPVAATPPAQAPPTARRLPAPSPAVAPAARTAQAVPDTAPAAAASPPLAAEPDQSASAAVVDVPVYPTRLPPAGRWRYRLQRGLAVGTAELEWAPQSDGRYALQLRGQVAGATTIDWASQGLLDEAGVAPERLAVRRRGRDTHAVNFQREAGKITFSGPTYERPLLPGAQDRLSWMLQLPAIVAAAPERFVGQASVVLWVVGARGDAEVWTFVVQGMDRVGDRPALKLLREPSRPYGIRAEVWLDPAEHHLPLRIVQTPAGAGVGLELLREPP